MEILGLKQALEKRGLNCRKACGANCPWRQLDVVELAREISSQEYWNRRYGKKDAFVDYDTLIIAALPYLSQAQVKRENVGSVHRISKEESVQPRKLLRAAKRIVSDIAVVA